MKWLEWEEGRQHTRYSKMLIWASRFPILWDCWLIKYTAGSYLPEHTDPVTGYNHYRLNIILKHAQKGGELIVARPIINFKRIKLFRSDAPHHLTPIERGERLVLSIGICPKIKTKSLSP